MVEKHQIGLIGGISYVIGSIIGSGIFVSPFYVLHRAGSPGLTLIIWAATGFICFLGACTCAELCTSIPRTGGEYTFLMYVGWTPLAYSGLWINTLLAIPSSSAASARAFSEYALSPFFVCNMDPGDMDLVIRLFAHALLWFLILSNFFRFDRYAAMIEILTTICKVSGLMIVISIGFWYIFRGETKYLQNSFDNSNTNVIEMGMAIYSATFSYGGWMVLASGLEELKDPHKNAPLSIVVGMILVTVIYVASNVAYLVVLGPETMSNTKTVAQTFATLTTNWLGYLVPIIVSISIAGGLNSGVFQYSRTAFAGGREHHLPRFLSLLHYEYGTPVLSLLLKGTLTSIFIEIGDVETLMISSVFLGFALQLFITGALIYIRVKKIPVMKNTVKYPIIVHILYFIIVIPLLVIPLIEEPVFCSIGIAVFLLFTLIYFLFVRPKRMAHVFSRMDRSLTNCFQKLFMCLPDDLKKINEDAGTNKRETPEKANVNIYHIKL